VGQVIGVVELVRMIMVDKEVVEGVDQLVGFVVQVIVMLEQLHQLHLDQHSCISDMLCSHYMFGMFNHSQQN
jgi:hypothetical protein